jgi:hypothetical protein
VRTCFNPREVTDQAPLGRLKAPPVSRVPRQWPTAIVAFMAFILDVFLGPQRKAGRR